MDSLSRSAASVRLRRSVLVRISPMSRSRVMSGSDQRRSERMVSNPIRPMVRSPERTGIDSIERTPRRSRLRRSSCASGGSSERDSKWRIWPAASLRSDHGRRSPAEDVTPPPHHS